MDKADIKVPEKRFAVLSDLHATTAVRDVTSIYSTGIILIQGVAEDEVLYLSWRVVDTKTGRTMCVFGGPSAYNAASVFQEYCNTNYTDTPTA